MPESQGSAPSLDRQPEGEAAHEARRRWQQEVTQALAERGLSIHGAAKKMGISAGSLQGWLTQDIEPNPRKMAKLAEVIGRSHLYLLQLLGWLPPEFGDSPPRLEASEQLQRAAAKVERVLHMAGGAVGGEDAFDVARAVLKRSNKWDARIRNVTMGRTYKVLHLTQLEFFPRAPHGGGEGSADAAADTAADRREITDLARYEIERTWSRWLAPDEVSAANSVFTRPDLVLSSPVLCAARPRGPRPDPLVPSSIAVLGIPLFGAREVAALVAGMLDWEYYDLTSAVSEMHGPYIEKSLLSKNPALVRKARQLLQDANTATEPIVWSWDDASSILETFPEIREESPLVVFMRASDSMLDYVFRRFNVGGSRAAVELETAQNVIRRTLEALENRNADNNLRLDLPELDPGYDPVNNADDLFDTYVELAFQAADWLHEKHHARSLSEASGVLSQLKQSGT